MGRVFVNKLRWAAAGQGVVVAWAKGEAEPRGLESGTICGTSQGKFSSETSEFYLEIGR